MRQRSEDRVSAERKNAKVIEEQVKEQRSERKALIRKATQQENDIRALGFEVETARTEAVRLREENEELRSGDSVQELVGHYLETISRL